MAFVRARHPEAGEAIIPVEAVDHYAARGWEAFGDKADDPNTLVVQQEQDRILAAAAATETVASGTVADVLAEVGDDPVRARAALDAEQASDHPRKTLVDKLTAITAAESATTTEE